MFTRRGKTFSIKLTGLLEMCHFFLVTSPIRDHQNALILSKDVRKIMFGEWISVVHFQ